MSRIRRIASHLWPNSLFGRLVLTWILAMWATHLINFVIDYYAEYREELLSVHYFLVKDVATAVDILEHTPPSERPARLTKLQRRQYTFALEAMPKGKPVRAERIKGSISELSRELGPAYPFDASEQENGDIHIRLRLHDGSPLTVRVSKASMPLSYWPAIILKLQMLAVVVVTWFAVRQVTRPLTRLAKAAESLGSSLQFRSIPETGPSEVVSAAAAFNAMQRRIAEHLEERVRILAAISHDLQTPLTRMRLRADLADSPELRDKFHQDLDAMQVLVEEGITYARIAHGSSEPPRRIDLDAFLDSIAGDYADTGKPIARRGRLNEPLTTRPNALKRIVTNLLDNACKFGDDVELAVERAAQKIVVVVRDRGPGIPESELEAVMQPFYRLEGSRNRDTGGTGLGLAIAQQLSLSLGGKLSIANRHGGGLEACLFLPLP